LEGGEAGGGSAIDETEQGVVSVGHGKEQAGHGGLQLHGQQDEQKEAQELANEGIDKLHLGDRERETSASLVVTCSFYDKRVHLWTPRTSNNSDL
jgi:hypothetical protein